MTFLKDHFDHLTLVFLGVLGAVGGIVCSAHHMDKPSEWCLVEAAAALSALLMRMTGPRPTPTDSKIPNGQ
jgi:hypothetical protein